MPHFHVTFVFAFAIDRLLSPANGNLMHIKICIQPQCQQSLGKLRSPMVSLGRSSYMANNPILHRFFSLTRTGSYTEGRTYNVTPLPDRSAYRHHLHIILTVASVGTSNHAALIECHVLRTPVKKVLPSFTGTFNRHRSASIRSINALLPAHRRLMATVCNVHSAVSQVSSHRQESASCGSPPELGAVALNSSEQLPPNDSRSDRYSRLQSLLNIAAKENIRAFVRINAIPALICSHSRPPVR